MNSLAPPSDSQLSEDDISVNFESFSEAPTELEGQLSSRGTNALTTSADLQLNEEESATNFDEADEAPEISEGSIPLGTNALVPEASHQLNDDDSVINFQESITAPEESSGELARQGMNSLATGADPQLNEQEETVNFDDGSGIGGGGDNEHEIDIAEIEATENIPALSLVTGSGKVADSNNTTHFNRVIGITMDPVVNGFISTCVVEGEVTDPSWDWPGPDAKIFLNGTTLSTSPVSTGFSQLIGITRNSQTIFIRLQVPILL